MSNCVSLKSLHAARNRLVADQLLTNCKLHGYICCSQFIGDSVTMFPKTP